MNETNNATYHAKVVMKAVPRWIPLKERKPSKEGEYLVSFDDGFIATTGYYEGDFELWADAGEPLAWMPLPEPYQEEK